MAGIDPISNVADAAAKIISLFKSNPTVKLADDFTLRQQELQGQIEVILGQLKVDAVEAASKSLWVAGWRPYIGWVCGTAFAVPVIVWLVQCGTMLWHGQYNLPQFDSTEMVTVLFGLLGLGTMRTYEKVQGKAGPGQVGD